MRHMQFAWPSSVSWVCHAKLHHFGDAKCSKKNIAILPIVARSSFQHIANTLSTTRPCCYALLSRTDSRPAACQHPRVAVQSKKTWRSSSAVFSHKWQWTSQSDINGLAYGDNPNINTKVNIEFCVAFEHSKYHSNYPPYKIYDYTKYDA
jgi:hypothetical protein